MAFFCTETGIRIASPGVHKSVDPKNGHDEVREVNGELKVVPAGAPPDMVLPNAASKPSADAPPPPADPKTTPAASKPSGNK